MTERNSIYTFKTELSLSRNELIDRIQQQANHLGLDVIDMLNSSSRRYPLAVRNSLRVANDLENVQKFDGQYSGIADMIESELYSRILSDEFKCKNQTVLYERKSGQKASIEGKGVDEYELYRFDAEEGADLGSHGKTNEIETHNKKLGLLFATLIRRWLMSKCEIPILDKAYKYRNRKNSGAVLKELADNMLPV